MCTVFGEITLYIKWDFPLLRINKDLKASAYTQNYLERYLCKTILDFRKVCIYMGNNNYNKPKDDIFPGNISSFFAES